jgi:hypothetical protein
MVSHMVIDQDMTHPKPPKAEGARIDGSMDKVHLRGSTRLTHCPNMQNEVIFKNKDSCIFQKNTSFVKFGKNWRPLRVGQVAR